MKIKLKENFSEAVKLDASQIDKRTYEDYVHQKVTSKELIPAPLIYRFFAYILDIIILIIIILLFFLMTDFLWGVIKGNPHFPFCEVFFNIVKNLHEFWLITLTTNEIDVSLIESLINLLIFIVVLIQVLFYFRGQSIGKFFMKIYVAKAGSLEGKRVSGFRLFIRELAKLISIVLFPINILFLFRKDNRLLHDFLTNTKVLIYRKNKY